MPIDIPRIQALCFDVDGTLSDTDDKWVNRMVKYLQPLQLISPRMNLKFLARRLLMAAETPGNLVYHILDRLGLDDEAAVLVSTISRFLRGDSHHGFWIIPGVPRTLAVLAEKFPMAVVSARGEASTLTFLWQFDLLQYFPVVVTGQTCHYTKPFPDPVIYAAKQLGVSPQNCLMIGDSTVDIRAGRAAGAQTVGVLCGFGQEKELQHAGADLILASTADLQDVFLKEDGE